METSPSNGPVEFECQVSRRMHLTSRLYPEEPHRPADHRDAARAYPLTEPRNRPRPPVAVGAGPATAMPDGPTLALSRLECGLDRLSSTKSPSELSSSSPTGVSSQIGSLTILSAFWTLCSGIVLLKNVRRPRRSIAVRAPRCSPSAAVFEVRHSLTEHLASSNRRRGLERV
jgi:hypothetical protein